MNHIIIMVQENRSFDHYFGHLGAYRAAQNAGLAADIDGTPANVSLKTFDLSPNVSPFHMTTMCTLDLSSNWTESHETINLQNPQQVTGPPSPPMDGAAYAQGAFCNQYACFDTAGKRSVGYYTEADLPFYYWGATQFATSNRWFSPVPARTQLNRMYLLAATSQGHASPPPPGGWDITAKSIFEALQDAGISWKVYVTNFDPANPASGSYMSYFDHFTPQHLSNFVDAKTFASDAAAGTLPQVALIESGYEVTESQSEFDEHPTANVQVGSNYVRGMVTALMNSPSWKDSVFFLTFDEFGGFYDHVPPIATVNPDGIAPVDNPPPPGDFTITGLRVPLIVFSPFTKPHYVSNTPVDYTAMLKFIETRFNIPPLTKRDAAQPDIQEFFDWSAPNLNSTNAPVQPTNGPCYFNKLP
ncbi:MAG TPA: alkaline phosphatase family protein [Candidatus Acidoferrales bacterium]|nr:alkaline phosphatase family protein [Candidatus Acidoferrales bacterium]